MVAAMVDSFTECCFPSFMRMSKHICLREGILCLDRAKIRGIRNLPAIHSAAKLAHRPEGKFARSRRQSPINLAAFA
jgi:hypothetical protein